MEAKLVKLSNRARYIQETLVGNIDLRRKTAEQVTALLTGMNFALIDDDFKYLVKMPMDSVTQENVANIMKEKENTEIELNALKSKTLQKMWLDELNLLETEYNVYKLKREKIQSGGNNPTAGGGKTPKKKLVIKK
jgi:hypothetical protein